MNLRQLYLVVVIVIGALICFSAFRNVAAGSVREGIEVWDEHSQKNDPTPTPRAALFSDDFTEPTTFEQFESESSQAIQGDGFLRISINEPEIFAFSELSQTFQDVTIEVDARMVGGPYNNGYGVSCRMSEAGEYDFEISSDGYFGIFFWSSEEGYQVLVDWTRSGAIFTQKGIVNRIAATCLGNQLSLSVNGQHLATVVDDSLDDGTISLFAESLDESDISVEFENVELLEPTEAGAIVFPEDDLPIVNGSDIVLPLSDDFSGATWVWQYEGTDATGVQQNDAYVVTVHDPQWLFVGSMGANFADVAIEVEARRVDGPRDNAFGVACRVTREHQYMFNISGNGFYRILLNKAEGDAVFLVDWTTSPIINTAPDAFNHISAICLGNQLTLTVNGAQLASVTDDTIAVGDVAVVVTAFDTPGVSIAFDNLELSDPAK